MNESELMAKIELMLADNESHTLTCKSKHMLFIGGELDGKIMFVTQRADEVYIHEESKHLLKRYCVESLSENFNDYFEVMVWEGVAESATRLLVESHAKQINLSIVSYLKGSK